MTIQERLFVLRDEKYAAFTAKLIPNIEADRIIGVRSPQLARLVKELRGTPDAELFITALPHRYLEENGLHASLVNTIKDYDTTLQEVERLLPYIDNWATCDTLSPKCFARHTDKLLPHVRCWMAAGHEYTCRFGIGMLMRHYLGPESFREEFLQWVATIDREEYYVRMMQAWYFATALAKQWDATLSILDNLTPWVRRKTIQKACESFRVPQAHKTMLRTL